MEQLEMWLSVIKDWLWSAPFLFFLLGTGVYLTFIIKGIQFRYLGYAIKEVFAKQQDESEGDISHFEALMTTLAGAIGTGAIVGVATAVSIGGMGALFWMWVTALFGMATKYAESLLAVKYREVDAKGEMIGGPMEYIGNGLGWKKVAVLFAVLGVIGSFGTGNLIQVNAISESLETIWAVDPWVSGIGVAIITGLVLVGGVKSIGHVAGVIVPFMALFYMAGGLIIIAFNIDKVPGVFYTIFVSAFQGQAAAGGFLGATVMMAVQMGVARSVLSNEAGLGISSIAAAAAKTDSPVRQALITMTGALMSTIIVCTVTGLVLGVTGVVGTTDSCGVELRGACMAIAAFSKDLPGGAYIVTIGLILFAFSTIIAWAYYGEKCMEYLFGEKSVIAFRIIFCLAIIPGAVLNLGIVWDFTDIANGLMALPNLVALLALTKVITDETNKFFRGAEV